MLSCLRILSIMRTVDRWWCCCSRPMCVDVSAWCRMSYLPVHGYPVWILMRMNSTNGFSYRLIDGYAFAIDVNVCANVRHCSIDCECVRRPPSLCLLRNWPNRVFVIWNWFAGPHWFAPINLFCMILICKRIANYFVNERYLFCFVRMHWHLWSKLTMRTFWLIVANLWIVHCPRVWFGMRHEPPEWCWQILHSRLLSNDTISGECIGYTWRERNRDLQLIDY